MRGLYARFELWLLNKFEKNVASGFIVTFVFMVLTVEFLALVMFLSSVVSGKLPEIPGALFMLFMMCVLTLAGLALFFFMVRWLIVYRDFKHSHHSRLVEFRQNLTRKSGRAKA